MTTVQLLDGSMVIWLPMTFTYLLYRNYRIFFMIAGVMEPSSPPQIRTVGVNMSTDNITKLLMVLLLMALSMALTSCSKSLLVRSNPKEFFVILTVVFVKAWQPLEL